MYVPNHFKAQSPEEVKAFIKANSFAILVTTQDGRPIATHIPLLLVEKKDGALTLQGHISKANPQWKNIEAQTEVLAIFSEPHAYISSSWYGHVNVPTWNYIAVHVYGKVQILKGEMLEQSIADLVEKYEFGRETRFHLQDLSPTDLKRQLRGIVGLELSMDRVEASYKLSQNRNAEDHQNVIDQLEQSGGAQEKAIAEAMKKWKK
jgi:transcriptional regulator